MVKRSQNQRMAMTPLRSAVPARSVPFESVPPLTCAFGSGWNPVPSSGKATMALTNVPRPLRAQRRILDRSSMTLDMENRPFLEGKSRPLRPINARMFQLRCGVAAMMPNGAGRPGLPGHRGSGSSAAGVPTAIPRHWRLSRCVRCLAVSVVPSSAEAGRPGTISPGRMLTVDRCGCRKRTIVRFWVGYLATTAERMAAKPCPSQPATSRCVIGRRHALRRQLRYSWPSASQLFADNR